MKEFIIEKLNAAVVYVDRMAEGKDPVTNQIIENDVLNNAVVIRCLYLVKEVLEETIANGGVVGNGDRNGNNGMKENSSGIANEGITGTSNRIRNDENVGTCNTNRKESKKKKADFPIEALQEYEYRKDQSITHVLRQFMEPVQDENVKRLNPVTVNKWLAANGYLEKTYFEESQRECWVPTEKGMEIGMYAAEHNEPGFQYATTMYSEQAQRFLIARMGEILGAEDRQRNQEQRTDREIRSSGQTEKSVAADSQRNQ